MDNSKLNGRTLYQPRGGRDPAADIVELIDAIVRSDIDLFNQGDRPVCLVDGAFVPVNIDLLRELIPRQL